MDDVGTGAVKGCWPGRHENLTLSTSNEGLLQV